MKNHILIYLDTKSPSIRTITQQDLSKMFEGTETKMEDTFISENDISDKDYYPRERPPYKQFILVRNAEVVVPTPQEIIKVLRF